MIKAARSSLRRMLSSLSGVALLLFPLASTSFAGNTTPSLKYTEEDNSLYLEPGQCVQMRSSRICAKKVGVPIKEQNTLNASKEILAPYATRICREGRIQTPKNIRAIGWTLYSIVIQTDGSKTETVINSYGNKADCETDLKRINPVNMLIPNGENVIQR